MPLVNQQFKLLLWKDYLIRKRKLITLAGIIWATLVISSLYIVRTNVDNYNFPTCQFPARALPSAGMLNFIQSFMCSVDNECTPLDQFQDIPTYENSKLTHLQRKLSPLLNNKTVLETVDSVPSALKLIGSLSKAADEPTFISLTKNGLRVQDLFRDRRRAKYIIMDGLNMTNFETDQIMTAEISLQGVLKGKLDICDYEGLSGTILTEPEVLQKLSSKLCNINKRQMQDLFLKLIVEIDFQKYLDMLGTMYENLNGDKRLLELSHMLSAVLRMSNFQSFLPKELDAIFKMGTQEQFRYFDLNIIPKLISTFEPTFGETEAYISVKNLADTSVAGLQWLYNMIKKNNVSAVQEASGIAFPNIRSYKDLVNEIGKVSRGIDSAFRMIKSSVNESLSLDETFSVLSKATSFALKFLSPEKKHDVLFYSTLLAKLVEGAHDVIIKNLNMEKIIFNVSMNHPDGVRMFGELPPEIRSKAVEGLTDADRVHALTSKLNKPSQIFCDAKRLGIFFKLPANKITELKGKLCNNVWNSYISDLITSFGIYKVKEYINSMASLLIQETLGKDTSDQLYSPEAVFKSLQDLVKDLLQRQADEKPVEWGILLKNDTHVLKEFKGKKTLGKEILITVHGAMAREIVQQNIILDMKLSPIFKQVSYFVKTLIEQVNVPDKTVLKIFKEAYPDVVETLLLTSLNEEKTYNLLSWSGIDLYCSSRSDFSEVLTFSSSADKDNLTSVMCKYSIEMDKSIKTEGFLTKTIKNINSEQVTAGSLDWSKLINNLRILYSNLYENYPYLFEPTSFNMNIDTSKRINDLFERSKNFWFESSLERTVHVGIKGALFALDLLDYTLDDVQKTTWQNIKHRLNAANGPIVIIDEIVKITIAAMSDSKDQSSLTSNFPPTTSFALRSIIPNLAQLIIDTLDLIKRDDTPIEPVIELINSAPHWPCSDKSLADVLNMTEGSKMAVRHIEVMICFNDTLQQEWRNYGEAQQAKKLIEKSEINGTLEFKDHLFLRMSRNFDELVRDSNMLQKILKNLPENDKPTIFDAIDLVSDFIQSEDRNFILRNYFKKMDAVLLSANAVQVQPVSLNILWEEYVKCSRSDSIDEACRIFGRTVWKYSLEFFSVMADSMAGDLIRYFRENNEPDANLLQIVGFTKNTGLYLLYDRFVDFLGVLLNSYWDYGFMSQVRKASRTSFWDCEAVVDSLVIPQGSVISDDDIRRVKPYVCASLLFWVSLPRGENTLLDVIAKPQYYFYTMRADNLTSNYTSAYNNLIELTDVLKEIANKNGSADIKTDSNYFNSINNELDVFADNLTSFKINETSPSFKLFNEINRKQLISSVYLTRIVKIILHIQTKLEEISSLELDSDKTEDQKLKTDLAIILKKFKRRPTEALALHFDILTNAMWSNNRSDNYSVLNSLDYLCEQLNNSKHIFILADDKRFLAQICAKNYRRFYQEVDNMFVEDLYVAQDTFKELANNLGSDDIGDDIFSYLSQQSELVRVWSQSIKHADDTGTALYLQYLHTTLNHYDIILNFLSGDNWWNSLRKLYDGPYANTFFKAVENSLGIFDEIINSVDKIKLVKLLYDIKYNDTETFCKEDIHLSEYIPDRSGALDALKTQICSTDEHDLHQELPLMMIVSKVYSGDTVNFKDLNFTAIENLLLDIETRLKIIEAGPLSPSIPEWITADNVKVLNKDLKNILSKDTLVKAGFGMVENIFDSFTLFLNKDCKCTTCCSLTGWFKQLNLQLYKKQEYDTLLCNLEQMTDDEIYDTLNADFHWDMAVQELLASRNYTNLELNRSINELLDIIKLNVLDDVSTFNNKLSDCLNRNASRNHIGNFTLFITVASKTLQLLRIQLPHLQEIPGFKENEFWQRLNKEIAPKLHVVLPISAFVDDKAMQTVHASIQDQYAVDLIKNAQLDLYSFTKTPDLLNEWLIIPANESEDFCKKFNCTEISDVIYTVVNDNNDQEPMLNSLQSVKFWSLSFISSLIEAAETTLGHTQRILALLTRSDINGALEGNLAAILDTAMQLLLDRSVDDITYSLEGVAEQLYPLLKGTLLDKDLLSLSRGLHIFKDLKTYLLENMELKVKVSELFPNKDKIEKEMKQIGINKTNFWSGAAPIIQDGHIYLKPLFTNNMEEYRISSFVCDPEFASQVVIPSPIDQVSENFYWMIGDQFCAISDETAKKLMTVLIENVNVSFVMDKMFHLVLSQIITSSGVSLDDGERLMSRLPALVEMLPMVQGQVQELSQTFTNEPVFAALKDFSSVGGLLSSSEFMSSAGMMLCGKPFKENSNRILKAVIKAEDFSSEPDREQLDALPTEFCRSLYADIVSIDGGKIVWSFIKPLLMGKLLYTPDTPAVQNIIRQANSSFASMSRLFGLVESLSGSFSGVEDLQQHQDGAEALASLLPLLLDQDTSAASSLSVTGMLDQLGDVKAIKSLVNKTAELLKCLNLNRFIPMKDEFTLTHKAVNLTRINEFSAGLVFMNVSEWDGRPYNVEYKIRMDIDTVPTTAKLRNQIWIPGAEASFIEDMRYFRGFVQVQDLVDRAVIELATGRDQTRQGQTSHLIGTDQTKHTSRITRETRGSGSDEQWAIYTQQMPYPCYKKDYFQTSLYESQALVVALFFSLVFTVCSAIRFNVAEKESGNTMLMSVMGVRLSAHTSSWFVASFTEVVLTCVCMTLVLYCGNILPRTDVSLILAVMVNYGFSVLMFCYVVTRLSNSASLGAVAGGLALMITYMPFVLVLSMELVLTDLHKLFTSLSMSSAFAYSIYQITRAEAMGVGAHWSNLWDAEEDHITLGVTMLMVTFDAVLYLTIGYAIDLIWGPQKVSNNIVTTRSCSEKAGVSVVDVGVEFAGGRQALVHVNVELVRGQVTALLGHNGAGKTTLIKVITGMLRPTSGHVAVRASGGGDVTLGVCPQQDVLFEQLTVDEHLALYAQLKSGATLAECQEDIKYIRSALQLGERACMPTRKLSGGERRRVCVALSFLARPHLVLLDEPSTGVDPAARRDIWAMIEKLREDRTILLTTHHMDEAELLSDQVVIMHKGQVHTVGSPVEIKRSLGTGYKLTVTFPEAEPRPESCERLLESVRRVVHNAYLLDACGFTVQLGLPFYDQHGLNNDYLELCEQLESQRPELGFSKFQMDCSSLEQVLYNICSGVEQTGEQHDLASEASHTSTTSISNETPSKGSVRADDAALVSPGAISGSAWAQFTAILHKRLVHYIRNKWLWWVVLGLPTVFLVVAMWFSTIRPPPDQERPLPLSRDLYQETTSFILPTPSVHSELVSPDFGEDVMRILMNKQAYRAWTPSDTPACGCEDAHQQCEWSSYNATRPEMMVLPDVDTLNHWIVSTHDKYIEKRYTGFSSALTDNRTAFIAWYNNKGHHSMPAAVSAVNSAILKRQTARPDAAITAYTHPLKISNEQLSKTTIYQHIADAGIAALVLLAYSLIPSGAAAYLVQERRSGQKTLQLMCGVSPAVYWAAALLADITIIVINIGITACVMSAFGFPVFVARDNLPAICLLLFLFGLSCNALVHVCEKMFTDASMSTMVVFCGNVFVGLSAMALLLILDLISESDATDNARWVLHKIFMLSPQFVLGDALIEIAKNTVQAQVLERFGMDTYASPLSGDVVRVHYVALVLVGLFFTLLNLAIEYRMFDYFADRWCSYSMKDRSMEKKEEGADVVEERRRVMSQLQEQLTIPTIHNIQKVGPGDVGALVGASRTYRGRVALHSLTLGLPRGQCTALLGENGAGKSTTFSLLSGERRPTSGEVHLQLQPATAALLHQGRISYCPQTDAIDMLLTAQETLEFYCRLRGIHNINPVVKRTLELFQLSKYASVRSEALSGGNKRKLCTAIAFMGRTELVLLDEPTSGMDPGSRACVSRGASEAVRAGRAVVVSTHLLGDAQTLAHRLALLHRGHLAALGTVTDCLIRFGGGYVVSVSSGNTRGVWEAVRGARGARGARLRALHAHTLQFILPTRDTGRAEDLKLSEVFRLMAELQTRCDIEDYTINQSTLDEMFLNSSRSDLETRINMDDLHESIKKKNEQIEHITPL